MSESPIRSLSRILIIECESSTSMGRTPQHDGTLLTSRDLRIRWKGHSFQAVMVNTSCMCAVTIRLSSLMASSLSWQSCLACSSASIWFLLSFMHLARFVTRGSYTSTPTCKVFPNTMQSAWQYKCITRLFLSRCKSQSICNVHRCFICHPLCGRQSCLFSIIVSCLYNSKRHDRK